MKITDNQYFWLVTTGMLTALPLTIVTAIYEKEFNANPVLIVGILFLTLPVGICYFMVILEIWSIYKLKAIFVVIVLVAFAALIHPAILLLVLPFGPVIYWITHNGGKGLKHEST